MYYRASSTPADIDSTASFDFHAWMIARFIEKPDPNKPSLSYYVIAVCYERMIKRMTYRTSESFREALKNLPPTFELPEKLPQINVKNSNDKLFISSLLEFVGKNRLKLKTPIDNLAKHRDDLYNQETYKDFHSILHEVLELFLESLNGLKKMHAEVRAAKTQPNIKDIIAKLDFIALVGTLLRLLVKSRAIKRCLYSIVEFLPDRAAGVKAKVDDDNERDEDDEEDERDEDDEDDEDDGLYEEAKSQACLRSLNLGVVYIDAILVLSHFVKKISESVNVDIDIKILHLPRLPKDAPMLPWRKLLQHDTYFPGKPEPSTKDIIEFLELRASSTGNRRSSQTATDNQKSSKKDQKSSKKGQKSSKKSQESSKKSQESPATVSTEASPESIIQTVSILRRGLHVNNDTFTREIDQVVNSLTMLEYDDTTPGSTKYIQHIIKLLESVKGLRSDEHEEMNQIFDEVMDMLRILADNTRLERMLQQGSPLDTGIGFKGTTHAEICLAAHCTFTDSGWFPPVSYFIIVFCSDLLILLVAQLGVCYTSSRCI